MNSKVFEAVMGMRWAILPEALEQIIAVVNRDFDPEALARSMHSDPEAMKLIGHDGAFNKQAVAAIPGDPLPGAERVRVRDGVAIISVIGPIFPRSNLFTRFSGGVSIAQTSLDFNIALESAAVDSILFNFDSPGGDITGVSEFSQMIYMAGCGGKKRKAILGYASGMMASAAYWIGSSVDELFVNTTSEVGSIGVVAGFTDQSQRDEKAGVKRIEVISSQSPKKRASPSTDTGRAEIQRVVDELADVFIAEVARNRKVETEDVANNFGEGGLIIGENTIKRKMADQVGSLEGVISLAVDRYKPKSNIFYGGTPMDAKEKKVEFTMTVEAVKEQSPEVYEQIKQSGFVAGADAERKRIQAIETIKAPGFEALIAENKFDPEATKESVASLVLEAQEKKRSDVAKALKEDGEEAANKTEGTESGSGEYADEDADRKSAVNAMVSGANSSPHRRVAPGMMSGSAVK